MKLLITFRFAAGIASVACLAAAASAQEPQVSGVQVLQIDASGAVSDEMRSRIVAGAAALPLGPSGVLSIGSSGNFDPGSGSQLFKLLANESVRNELQLTDAQYAGVKQINAESQKRMSDLFRANMTHSGKSGSSAVRIGGREVKEMMEANQLAAEEAVEEILLPEQLNRVRQLAYQVQIAQLGLGELLVNGKLGQEVGVHEDQKQHLTDRAAKIEAEARAAIKEIRARARAQLLSELAPDQRKKAEELLGEYFDYEEPSMQQQLQQRLNGVAPPKQY